MTPLLAVHDLRVRLPGRHAPVTIVDGVDYAVLPGQVFGIAGESGSGKTLSVLALMGLAPPGALIDGTAMLGDRDLLTMRQSRLRHVRGREVAIVFQDPMTSLHPMMTIERQMTEHARRHLKLNQRGARDRAMELLSEVRIPDPSGALRAYPHQFSGGMRQRIAIAMALICQPRLLIADEPTTALDVTVQAGILRLLDRLRKQFGLSIIFITHDLSVMGSIADELTVLYAGRVVESGPTHEVLAHPRHPYTAALLASIPRGAESAKTALVPIGGASPSSRHRPSGCAFHPRCRFALAECAVVVPELRSVPADQRRELACLVDPYSGSR
jgi:oligopeptide transport system ATP-binding protein